MRSAVTVRLRSSPTPEGRCWTNGKTDPATEPVLRSSPTPEGRCREVDVADRAAVHTVAILTDPGGTVLGTTRPIGESRFSRVAILTDPGGTVLGGVGPSCV